MSMKPMIKGSTLLAKTIHGHGITHVFLMEAAFRYTLMELEQMGVTRVLAHSEKGAAFMADGYARARRGPAVCMCQSVGSANMASGLHDAYLSNSPVIALTGKKTPMYQHRNAYQELAHHPLFEPVTKYNVDVAEADQLPLFLRQAFREAASGCPGPVHLDVNGLAGNLERSAGPFDVIVENRYSRFPPFRPEPEADDVEVAATLLTGAKKPIIIAGAGAVCSGAHQEVVALAEKLRIPIAFSPDGKGIVPESHPLCLGVTGFYGRGFVTALVREADLVLYIGSGTGDQVTLDWTSPPQGTTVIQIDIDPMELGRNYPNAVSLLGDAKKAVAAMVRAVGKGNADPAWLSGAVKTREAWRESVAERCASERSPIATERLCADLSTALPQDAVLIADTGYSSMWTGILVDFLHPGQRYFRPAGGSLGWGFPAALGVKCALPKQPVVAFVGDGGFWYHLTEMETAARHGINTVTVLNNNGGFGQCYPTLNSIQKECGGNVTDLWRFKDTNFSRLAEEMGGLGIRVERAADIAPALRKALAANRPVLVEVMTDIACNPPK